MQFSKRVTQLARLYNVDPKDVFFATLITAGLNTAESFSIIYRPASTTTAALSTKASNYIGQRPGLKRLIDFLDQERNNHLPTTDQDPAADGQASTAPTAKRRGRPRKEDGQGQTVDDMPCLDYTNKDAILQELARIVMGSDKESDRLAAIKLISELQKMKQEAAVEDEKRVVYYIPLTYERAEELRLYLSKYYEDKANSKA